MSINKQQINHHSQKSKSKNLSRQPQKNDIVINYHITEKCNYLCHYCFAKYGLEEAFKKEIHNDLSLVKIMLEDVYNYFKNGNKNKAIRLNFAGGEPLLLKKMPDIIKIAYDIGFKVSIISNGSALTQQFINKNARYLSVFGLSIDSFQEEINHAIGRVNRAGNSIKRKDIIEKINLIKQINPAVSIKINTVISELNYNELMVDDINAISPDKWKIFEVLPNGDAGGKVTTRQFKQFISNHNKHVNCPKFVEYKDDLLESYIMIDPLGRFYQRQSILNSNIFSEPIIKLGSEQALKQN